MTDRRDDLVEAFLADLGAADAPAGLAASVMRAVREQRPQRVSRAPAWLAVAAVLATAALVLTALALIVASPGPSPSPAIPASPVASPEASPTPEPTIGPPAPTEAFFHVHLDAVGTELPGLDLVVSDVSGTVTGAESWPWPAGAITPGGLPVAFGPGSDDRSVVVFWTSSVCDYRASLELAADGRTVSLRFPVRTACDAYAISYAVQLHLSETADPATFRGSQSDDLVTALSVAVPLGAAFIDDRHGFTAWRTEPFDAVILETTDGGLSWRVEGLGAGTITALAVTGGGQAWAGVSCPEGGLDGCQPGRYRYDEGLWILADADWPVALSFAGDVGAGLFLSASSPRDATGVPIPELRLMDEGEVWTAVANPCPTNLRRQAVARVGVSTILALCESDGFTGNSFKELHRSTDGAVSWTKMADGPYNGTGMAMDLLADGTGWMWGARSPLLATIDGGATWTPLDVADGDVRLVSGADAMGGGSGVVLVRDPDKSATFLLRTEDGQSWAEVFDWPAYCCGG